MNQTKRERERGITGDWPKEALLNLSSYLTRFPAKSLSLIFSSGSIANERTTLGIQDGLDTERCFENSQR